VVLAHSGKNSASFAGPTHARRPLDAFCTSPAYFNNHGGG